MLFRTEGFPGVILRLFLTYGPNQDEKRFLPQIIKACLRGDDFPVSEGFQYRDFCYVEDVIRAILLALRTNDVEGNVFNIASGRPVLIRSVIENVQQYVGRGRPLFGEIPYRPEESMSLYANIQKAADLLGWFPEVTFEMGLKLTIESFRKSNA